MASSLYLTDGGKQRATRQELITELQRLHDELDHLPSFQDMDKHGKYSGALYAVRFDTWNNALREAGFEPKENPNQKFSDEELIEDLQTFADSLGETPSSKAMNEHGPHNSKTYKDRFGTWNNALEQADLELNRTGSTALPEHERKNQLLDALLELAETLGRVPTQKEIREHTDHSHNTYYNHWGGIKQALDAAGADLGALDTTRKTKPRTIETEDLLEELQRLADTLGHQPRWTDIREHSKYSDSPYRSRFESLDEALREARILTEQ